MSNGNGFQFSKGVSIGHVITTVALAVGMMGFAFDLRESIAILQFKGETTEQRLERAIERTDSQFDEIMDHLIRLEEKIDDILLAKNPMQKKGAR